MNIKEEAKKLLEKVKGKDKKEAERIVNKWIIKNFPEFTDGFFEFNGKVFKVREERKKSLFGTLTRLQGYIFDVSINDWRPISQDVFNEAAKNGIHIKELPKSIEQLIHLKKRKKNQTK